MKLKITLADADFLEHPGQTREIEVQSGFIHVSLWEKSAAIPMWEVKNIEIIADEAERKEIRSRLYETFTQMQSSGIKNIIEDEIR